MWTRLLIVASAGALSLAAESLKDCRTIFLRPMPESLDEFAGVELLKWGAIKVVAAEDKADCVATFGRLASRTDVRSSGSPLVPSDARVDSETVRTELPRANAGIAGDRKSAAITLVHRESSQVVWAESKADGWSWNGGARALAKKLVDQMRRDYR